MKNETKLIIALACSTALFFGMGIYASVRLQVAEKERSQATQEVKELTVELKSLREESIKNYGTIVNDLTTDADYLDLQRLRLSACGIPRGSVSSELIGEMADDNRKAAEEYQADKEALLRKVEVK